MARDKYEVILEKLDELGLHDQTTYSPVDSIIWLKPWVVEKLKKAGMLEALGLVYNGENPEFSNLRLVSAQTNLIPFRI